MIDSPSYQTATLPNGVRLAYTDSWAKTDKASVPKSYTTVIALHGAGCNSAVWEPMAAQLGGRVRVLAYNQRSYAGSDGAFDGQKEGGTDTAAAYLEDLVGFVDFAVDKLGVPGIGADGKGGVALLATALGPHAIEDVLEAVGVSVSEPDCARHGALGWGLAGSAEETMGLAREGVKAAEWGVGVVYGDHTFENCQKGVEMVEGWWKEAEREGRTVQPHGVRVVEGGTHFPQVLKPKEFAAAVVELLDELNPVVVEWF